MYTFSCSHCQAALSAEPKTIGSVVLCPKCKKQVIAPQPPTANQATIAAALVVILGATTRFTRRHPIWLLALVAMTASGVFVYFRFESRRNPTNNPVIASKTITEKATTNKKSPKLWDCDTLEKRLSQVTAQDVRNLLGNPDQIAQAAIGMPFSEDDPNVDLWVYRNKTRDAQTGRPQQQLLVWFRFGRVTRVQCLSSQPNLTPISRVPRAP